MPDHAQLELTISAKVDQALAGISGLEAQLAKLSTAHQVGAHHADTHGLSILTLAHHMESASARAEFLVAGFDQLKGALLGGGVLFGFEELIKHAAEFDIQADRLSRSLGGNAEAATAWIAIAKHMDIDVTQMQRGFNALNTGIANNHAIFREMGVATEDVNGKIRATIPVLNDVADWFQKNARAAGEADAANQLFGNRFGAQFIPILEQGSAGIAELSAHMKSLGLTMDEAGLGKAAAMAHELDLGKLAVEGLALRIGNALIPGLAVLSQAIVNNVGLMSQFTAAVEAAVSFSIGFLEGISGTSYDVSKANAAFAGLTDSVKGAGQGLDTNAGKAGNNAAAQRALRNATRDQIATLDDQIRAMQDADKEYDRSTNARLKAIEHEKKIQDASLDQQIKVTQAADKETQEAAKNQESAITEQSKVFQDQIDAQIQAIKDRSQAFDDSINDEIKSLESANRTEQEQDKLANLKASSASQNKRLALDQANYEKELAAGNFGALQAILDDEAAARLSGADVNKQIVQEERVIKVDSLKAQLDKQKETDTAALTDLERRKKADADRAADAIKNIQLVATQEKQGSDDLIGRLQEQKRIFDEGQQNTLDKLREEMQDRRDNHAEILAQINEQKRAIQEASNKELEAMQDAAAKGSEALRSGFANPSIGTSAAAAGGAAGLKFAQNFDAEKKGIAAAKDFTEAFGRIMSGDTSDLKAKANEVGVAIGDGIAHGIELALTSQAASIHLGPFTLGQILGVAGLGVAIGLGRVGTPSLPVEVPGPNVPNPGAGGDPTGSGSGSRGLGDPPPQGDGDILSAGAGASQIVYHLRETNRLLATIANDSGPSGSAAASRRVA